LSWYEIGLYIERFNYRQEEAQALQELEWARFRIQWADFRNAHRGKDSEVVTGKDLIKLSFDVEETKGEESKPSLKKAKQLLGSKFNLN